MNPSGLRRPQKRALGGPQVPADVVLNYLRRKLGEAWGSSWQRIGAALMIGDPQRARAELFAAAQQARRGWEREQARPGASVPNMNVLLRHFGFALVIGDDGALKDLTPHVRACLTQRAQVDPVAPIHPFAVHDGYLLLIAVLLDGEGPQPSPDQAQAVGTPMIGIDVASQGLLHRDAALLTRGLNAVLDDQVHRLERRSSPPPAVCEPAIHLAVAARRLGLAVEVDERYATYLVPAIVRDPPEYNGEVGRLPCDLLGRSLWLGE